MKLIKIYLVVATVLLFLSIGCGVYVWYTIQKLDVANSETPSTGDSTSVLETDTNTSPETPETTGKPTIITVDSLPVSQQELLKTFGYEADSFTITSAMITCGENAVGKERLDQIIKGSKPGPVESMKLFVCFKK